MQIVRILLGLHSENWFTKKGANTRVSPIRQNCLAIHEFHCGRGPIHDCCHLDRTSHLRNEGRAVRTLEIAIAMRDATRRDMLSNHLRAPPACSKRSPPLYLARPSTLASSTRLISPKSEISLVALFHVLRMHTVGVITLMTVPCANHMAGVLCLCSYTILRVNRSGPRIISDLSIRS